MKLCTLILCTIGLLFIVNMTINAMDTEFINQYAKTYSIPNEWVRIANTETDCIGTESFDSMYGLCIRNTNLN